MLTLWGNLESGNVYKVRLLWAWLGLRHRRIDVDQTRGEPATPAFRQVNPIGKVPAVRLDDGRVLGESGAILQFFANGTPFWPADAWQQAETLRWMFFEQYSHEPAIAVNRYLRRFMAELDDFDRERLQRNHGRGLAALQVMEDTLARQDWLVGDGPTIADVTLYAYTHIADEGGFPLAAYPAIGRWLARVRAVPGYFPLRQDTAEEVIGFTA